MTLTDDEIDHLLRYAEGHWRVGFDEDDFLTRDRLVQAGLLDEKRRRKPLPPLFRLTDAGRGVLVSVPDLVRPELEPPSPSPSVPPRR